MVRVNRFSLVLLLSLFCHTQTGLALSTDREQPINIHADKLDIDDIKNISTYQGNVEMQQGSLHIKADTIVFHFSEQNDLQRLEIAGSPATLNQLNDKNEPVSGTARHIIYTDNLLLLKLNGAARFQNNADTIESEWITINTQTEALKAGSIKGENRVHMLIQPKNPGNNNKK